MVIWQIARQASIAALLAGVLCVNTSQAQEVADDEPAVTVEEAKKKEQQEASSNLRDSVNENLESMQDDQQSVDALRQEQVELEQQKSSVEGPEEAEETRELTQAGEVDPAAKKSETEDQGETKKTFLQKMQAIPAYLQSVPDRIPYIRDKGLIFFGRSELDYAHYSSGAAANDSGFRLRSLRAGVARAFKYNISAKAELDFTDGDSSFADLYARWSNKRYGLFTIGNQKVAQTLVNQTSRISRTFMEEPLPAEAFGLGRRLAVGWDLHKPKGGFHMTVFGPDLNGSIGDSGYAGRAYFNPTRSRLNVFHIGASYIHENMSRKTRFFSHPESRVTSERFVDTGIYENITAQKISALEIAGARDNFMFRSELFQARWNRQYLEDPKFQGFYVQASWVLTGEQFNYVQGKFIRIRPKNPRGAWETAVRFSRVDLNDLEVKGGEETNLSFAVNWYSPGNQFRAMLNIIFVNTDEFAGNEDPTIFQLRGQFHW